MGSFPINPFDAAVYVCLFIAVVMGFMTGMLRSLPPEVEDYIDRLKKQRGL